MNVDVDEVLDKLGRREWQALNGAYWGSRLFALVLTGGIALWITGSVGGVLLWIWTVLGLLAFPFASYVFAGNKKVFYQQKAGAFEAVWDGRRRMGDNLTQVAILVALRVVGWVLLGLVAIYLWPLMFAVSLSRVRSDLQHLGRIVSIPERLFAGERIDFRTEEAKQFKAQTGYSVPQVREVTERLRKGLPLSPAQEVLADTCGLHEVWHALNGRP